MSKKVKLLRLHERQGLVRARLNGAKNATGDVLVFLDAHCEVTKGWFVFPKNNLWLWNFENKISDT